MQRKLRKWRQVNPSRNAIISYLIGHEFHLSLLHKLHLLLLLLILPFYLSHFDPALPDAFYFLPASAVRAAHFILSLNVIIQQDECKCIGLMVGTSVMLGNKCRDFTQNNNASGIKNSLSLC